MPTWDLSPEGQRVAARRTELTRSDDCGWACRGVRSLSASSSRLFSFTHLTFDSLGPPQGEARRKDNANNVDTLATTRLSGDCGWACRGVPRSTVYNDIKFYIDINLLYQYKRACRSVPRSTVVTSVTKRTPYSAV